jgi:low temperature requirement protein LtrA
VPDVFSSTGLLFACAYGVVRGAHIALFLIASRDDPALRHSVVGLAASTAVGVALLVSASFADHGLQGAIWATALLLDMGGPLIIDPSGWKLVPGHFAERHGLIVLIALGESIVAIGVGSQVGVDFGVVVAAVLGIAVCAALWWLYFDAVALVAERRLTRAAPGLERNTLARDSFSYLHFPMVAGIVLVALGLKKTLGHVGDPLATVPATALLGGTWLYLLAHVAFRLRNIRTLNRQRLLCAIVLLPLIALARQLPAFATLGILAAALTAVVTYETLHFAELRDRIRHRMAREMAAERTQG